MGVEFPGPVLDHGQSIGPIHRGQDRHAGLDDAGFLGGDFTHGATQHLHVVQPDGGDDRSQRGDDVRRIKPPAQPRLPEDHIDGRLGEGHECHDRGEFEEGGSQVGGHPLPQL